LNSPLTNAVALKFGALLPTRRVGIAVSVVIPFSYVKSGIFELI
jgi:hypothetical protein